MKQKLSDLLKQYETISKGIFLKQGMLVSLETQASTIDREIGDLKQLDISMTRVQKFFHSMGTAQQEQLQQWMQTLVTYGLQTVFGETYFFVIKGPEIARNEIVLTFEVHEKINDNLYSRDPYSSMGGGIADVLSFLLQFLIVFLLRDRIQPIIFIDEGFKHLARHHRPKMIALLSELVQKTNVQIVLVTHDQDYLTVADAAYSFERNSSGNTQVEKLK